MKRNKKLEIDETQLLRNFLGERKVLALLLDHKKIKDIYDANIEGLKNDNENFILNSMVRYLSKMKVISSDMRERGYEIVSLLFFDEQYRNKERTNLINQIKGILNLIKVDDDEFYKSEYNYFYDVRNIKFEDDCKFDQDDLFEMENDVNEFIYSLSCFTAEEYDNDFDLAEGFLFYINYILNNCKEMFQIEIFRKRVFTILAELKQALKESDRKLAENKEISNINKKIIKKAKKV